MASLLHDVGKIVYRTGNRKKHAILGRDFLEAYFKDEDNKKAILRAIENDHADGIKNLKTLKNDISYILYEADNIAAGADRRKNEGEEGSFSGFDMKTLLGTVFNVLQSIDGSEDNGNNRLFKLQGLMEQEKLQYPTLENNITASAGEYVHLLKILEHYFSQKKIDEISINEMLQVMEGVASYVPSSTSLGEVADISLYDHHKMTAAIAGCIYDYYKAKGTDDFNSICYKDGLKNRDEKSFILASGQLHGIEKFIYNVPSKGALRSLRGRSFFTDLLLENIIDELLDEMELSRCNLIYSGGGSFQLLLPNTSDTRKLFALWREKVNQWLIENYSANLYLSIGSVELSASDMMIKEESASNMGQIFRKLRKKLNDDNRGRYSTKQLQELFNPYSLINSHSDGEHECCVCHTSSKKLIPYDEDMAETMVCQSCYNLKELGKLILECDVIAIFKAGDEIGLGKENRMSLPAFDGEYNFVLLKTDEAEIKARNANRIYLKNKMLSGNNVAMRLWMADYVAKDNKGHILELEELALLSGGSKEEKGINRIGVLRADIDDLQLAVLAGFPERVTTFSRIAVLSRQLDLFFKRYINSICQGILAPLGEPGNKRFSMFADSHQKQRNVHVIYSGGGKLLIAGAWDDVIELAVDMRKAFNRFTNGKMTFSAGIGIYDAKNPISEIVRSTDSLKDYAKFSVTKDSIAMFGTVLNKENIYESNFIKYRWSDFIRKVCGEKLTFISENISITENSNDKLKMGKGLLYRIMELLRNSDNRINLARFAYVLGRLEPDRKDEPVYKKYVIVRETLYKWYKDIEDRKQLATAIELMIYKVREKGI